MCIRDRGEDTAAGRLARELAGQDTASSADVMRMLRAAESRQAEGGPGAQALVDPQLYTCLLYTSSRNLTAMCMCAGRTASRRTGGAM